MSLAGLLAAVAEDPQLRTALDSQPGVLEGGRDLVAPAALRPLLSAALATGVAGGPGRFGIHLVRTGYARLPLTFGTAGASPDLSRACKTNPVVSTAALAPRP